MIHVKDVQRTDTPYALRPRFGARVKGFTSIEQAIYAKKRLAVHGIPALIKEVTPNTSERIGGLLCRFINRPDGPEINVRFPLPKAEFHSPASLLRGNMLYLLFTGELANLNDETKSYRPKFWHNLAERCILEPPFLSFKRLRPQTKIRKTAA
ncbi:MAG: hypothetical protein VKJ06_08260 [Vampirovibrionales bacterium]|nr:hypothetical protein [Vampirovibrionales bacterium]